MPGRLKLPPLSSLSWVVAIVLTLCNVLLIKQNIQLRAAVRNLESEQRIRIGDKLETFKATDLEGNPAQLRFDQGGLGKIALFSSTNCPYCKRQSPKWNQLVQNVDRSKYEVVEIFRDKEAPGQVAAYLKSSLAGDEHSVKVFLVADDLLQGKKFNSTPTTLVVDKDGVVQRVWVGLWSESEAAEVGSFLGIIIKPN